MNKNLAVSAGDMDLDPSLERSHMPRSNETHPPQLLSLCSRAHTETCAPGAHAEQQEKPLQCEACRAQLERSTLAATGENPVQQWPKIIKSK